MAGRGLQNVSAIRTRANTSFALDAVIDGFLSEKDVEKLYDRYTQYGERLGWPEIYRMRANELMITCDQINVIPIEELQKAYGKAMAKRLKEAAEANTQIR